MGHDQQEKTVEGSRGRIIDLRFYKCKGPVEGKCKASLGNEYPVQHREQREGRKQDEAKE